MRPTGLDGVAVAYFVADRNPRVDVLAQRQVDTTEYAEHCRVECERGELVVGARVRATQSNVEEYSNRSHGRDATAAKGQHAHDESGPVVATVHVLDVRGALA